jgi:hypothetical protein
MMYRPSSLLIGGIISKLGVLDNKHLARSRATLAASFQPKFPRNYLDVGTTYGYGNGYELCNDSIPPQIPPKLPNCRYSLWIRERLRAKQ